MGLDITAYSGLKEVEEYDEAKEEAYYESGLRRFWKNPDFPASRFTPLKENMVYSYTQDYVFRAGSYSGYNHWREQLARLVGTTAQAVWDSPEKGGPFVELINFADNEGTFGSEVSKKLYVDFLTWLTKAETFAPGDPWFFEKYRHWMQAFKLASESGAVDLH